MTRVAAIDCGTNSIRLLVADADPATGELVDLDRRMTIVRLGQGVDRTGRLAPEALERTFAACREYAGIIKEHGAERLRFVATSASRDAENREDFVRGVLDILGVEPEVITGDQEAEFSFTGATRELTGRTDLARPYLVVDIGGGSTEFVVGDVKVRASRSGTVCSARSSAASMSARIAAICSSVGGSETSPPCTRCRSVIRTQPTSTERAARTFSSPTTNSVEPPPMSTTR